MGAGASLPDPGEGSSQCYHSKVRVRPALFLAALLGGAGGPARRGVAASGTWTVKRTPPDWGVKRTGSDAVVAEALGLLGRQPDLPGLAARLARLAGKQAIGEALESLRRAAERAPQRYEAQEAYAQLLAAAGRPADAASAFAMAMALRPEAVAPAAGRARALAAAGRNEEALGAYDDAF